MFGTFKNLLYHCTVKQSKQLKNEKRNNKDRRANSSYINCNDINSRFFCTDVIIRSVTI